jgi:hypothetical protein
VQKRAVDALVRLGEEAVEPLTAVLANAEGAPATLPASVSQAGLACPFRDQQERRPIGTRRRIGVVSPSTQTSIGMQADRRLSPIAKGKPVNLPTVPR